MLNEVGNVEMDALICDGKDLSVGSCVGVSKVKNPVRLARLVKDKTQHVMFSERVRKDCCTERYETD